MAKKPIYPESGQFVPSLGGAEACIWGLMWAEPCGLVPIKPARQAWTSVLAWYTGHTVGGQHHPGACLAGRLFQQSWIAKPGPASWLWYTGHPVVVSGTSWCHHCRGVSQQSWIAEPGPASWLWYTGHPVVVSGTSWCHHCRGVWVQGHRLVRYSCPLPPFAANHSTN